MKQAWFEIRICDSVCVVGLLLDDISVRRFDGDRYARVVYDELARMGFDLSEVRFLTIADRLSFDHSSFRSIANAALFIVGGGSRLSSLRQQRSRA